MAQYVGILDGEGSVWGIRIPDVPGCHGGGATPEEALADATGALREVAAHLAAEGVVLKAPRSIQEVIRDKDAEFNRTSEGIVLVPLILDRSRSVKANISLDAGILEAIDEEAMRRGLTRSGFLASASVDKIEQSPLSDRRSAVIRRLRAELVATHERIARLTQEIRGAGVRSAKSTAKAKSKDGRHRKAGDVSAPTRPKRFKDARNERA